MVDTHFSSKDRQAIGIAGEISALNYLQAQGLTLVVRNFRCKMGEIDLIMQERETLVFIEVRARSEQHYGGGAASITRAKQRKLIKTASFFLMKHPHYFEHPSRFDVIDAAPSQTGPTQIHWIPGAFSAF